KHLRELFACSRQQDVLEALRPLPADPRISAQSPCRLAYLSYEFQRRSLLSFHSCHCPLISLGLSIQMCCKTARIRTGITAECPSRRTTCSLSEGLRYNGRHRIPSAR